MIVKDCHKIPIADLRRGKLVDKQDIGLDEIFTQMLPLFIRTPIYLPQSNHIDLFNKSLSDKNRWELIKELPGQPQAVIIGENFGSLIRTDEIIHLFGYRSGKRLFYAQLTADDKLDYTFVVNKNQFVNTPEEELDKIAGSLMMLFLLAFIFIEFAPIETKILPPKVKVKVGRAKYLNKASLPVILVNSSWFTNLIISGEFKVKGHWRLQPYGPENSKRRLIWIKEFKKSGYKRKALKKQ